MNRRCYLYWIRTSSMTDMFSEGYIGVSVKPKARLKEHMYGAKNLPYYNKDFSKLLLGGKPIQQILAVGDVPYCLDLERKLRPLPNTGWNNAIGGGEGKYKHGLTGTQAEKIFRNLRSKAKKQGISIAEDMQVDALEGFCQWYEKNNRDGYVLRFSGIEELSLNCLEFVSKQESAREPRRTLFLKETGESLCPTEVAERYNIKPNTLVWRIKRGATLEQAIGEEKMPKREVLVNGRMVAYNGKLSQEQIDSLAKDVYDGFSLLQLGPKYEMDHSSLSRIVSKLGISLPRYLCKDLFGNDFEIWSHSKLSPLDYEEVKIRLLRGDTKTSIAKHLNVSASTITEASKKLKWEEFCGSQKRAVG